MFKARLHRYGVATSSPERLSPSANREMLSCKVLELKQTKYTKNSARKQDRDSFNVGDGP
jgi:hypothetical protein